MSFLLDTDALSFAGPESRLQGAPAARWRGWVHQNQKHLSLSAVTLMEVRYGIERLKLSSATRRADALAKWLLVVETIYEDRIVWISPEIADRAGVLLAQAAARGFSPGAEDALIAASALVTGRRLVSRNQRHMMALGVSALSPLGELPD